MSNDNDKTGNDVEHLLRHKQMGGVRYREFGTPKSTTPATDAAPVEQPLPTPAPAAPPALTMPAAPVAPLVASPAQAPADEQRLRSVSSASPLAFTFERLRRQAIATPARKPYLSLDLPERHPVQLDDKSSPRRQRLLQAVFAELEAHGQLRARGRA